MIKRIETGEYGEKIAQNYLKKSGYRLLHTNYRLEHGEIDIIAREAGDVVFIEVRTKNSTCFGTAEEALTAKKLNRIKTLAMTYISQNFGDDVSWRIDFIAIQLDGMGKTKRVELIKNVTI